MKGFYKSIVHVQVDIPGGETHDQRQESISHPSWQRLLTKHMLGNSPIINHSHHMLPCLLASSCGQWDVLKYFWPLVEFENLNLNIYEVHQLYTIHNQYIINI